MILADDLRFTCFALIFLVVYGADHLMSILPAFICCAKVLVIIFIIASWRKIMIIRKFLLSANLGRVSAQMLKITGVALSCILNQQHLGLLI